MTTTERRARTVAGLLAALIGLTLALPYHARPQAADLVTQGRQALDADRVDEAIGLLERAVAADSRNPAALAWLGSARVRRARTAPVMERAAWVGKGFDALDEAVERFPDAWIVYLVRGLTAVNLPSLFNKARQAAADLGTVAAMKAKQAQAVPDGVMPTVYLNLGAAYKKAGDRDRARSAWEMGRRLYPSAPEAAAIDRELRGL